MGTSYKNSSMDELVMGMMGAQGQSGRCLAVEMASCDSPSIATTACLACEVSHNNQF